MDQLSLWPGRDKPLSHRLFFAIRPDLGATGNVVRLMDRLRGAAIVMGRPVDPDRLHITLHWLGDFPDQMPQGLLSEASSVASAIKTQPLMVVFDRVAGANGLVLLPALDRLEALDKFQQTLSTKLITTGLRPPKRWRFAPHMTLAYDCSNVPERPVDPIRWTVRDFVLIESLIGKTRHIERGRWQIQG